MGEIKLYYVDSVPVDLFLFNLERIYGRSLMVEIQSRLDIGKHINKENSYLSTRVLIDIFLLLNDLGVRVEDTFKDKNNFIFLIKKITDHMNLKNNTN